MPNDRYYYEAPAEAFIMAEREGDGTYRVVFDCTSNCTTVHGVHTLIANEGTIVIELTEPLVCDGKCDHCEILEITKEIEENGQP